MICSIFTVINDMTTKASEGEILMMPFDFFYSPDASFCQTVIIIKYFFLKKDLKKIWTLFFDDFNFSSDDKEIKVFLMCIKLFDLKLKERF